ncbi:PRD domain-containing protein [Bacillus sp. FJAT-45037]|uniref:PRD domain-containing protein n=1 Tax=Bacillus sp. FJAT-45037 TaxID=2011007 RepID=UPI000C246523|nr:PRD domain-containing protein [Bacillus sp. FJAT-45037]
MSDSFHIKKVVNNNVVIAMNPDHEEVILIGRGIGFGQKRGQSIEPEAIDKLFVLADREDQEQYKQLLDDVDESFINLMAEVVRGIQDDLKAPLHERIHLALADHIQFAVRRIKQGIDIPNPFLTETELMFPQEFQLARNAVLFLNEHLEVELPEAEIGFVALHIYSATSNQKITEMHEHPQLILELVQVIEHQAEGTIQKRTVEYMRLVHFLCDVIDRFRKKETIDGTVLLSDLLKEEFNLCYNITEQIVNKLNQRFETAYKAEDVPDVVFYLQKLIKNI